MINQKQSLLVLICFCIFANIPAALCSSQPVIYVSGQGASNYICDGVNDQIQINQALDYAAKHPGTKVYLKGPFVYDIRSSCLIGSNTELTGDSTAKLRLHNYIGWTSPSTSHYMIGQIGSSGSVLHDIKIHGFEIDGNEVAQTGDGGKDLYRIISFQGSSSASVYNISVYHMNLHDAKGEGFRCTYGKNIYYYNNTGSNLQHTCVMYSRVNTGEIHDNVALQCSCAADRLDNCQNIVIENESISPYSGITKYPKDSKGYAYSDIGIYVVDANPSPDTSNIIVRNCNILSGVNGVLFDCLKDNSNVNFYNNIIHDSGYENEGVSRNGGIGICYSGNGIVIRNNDNSGSYVAGINVNSAVSGTHTITVANNNIVNGKTGYAVKNSVSSQVMLLLTHNYLYNNPADFYPASLVNTNLATSRNVKLKTNASLVPSEFFVPNYNICTCYSDVLFSIPYISDYISSVWSKSIFGNVDNNINHIPKPAYSPDE